MNNQNTYPAYGQGSPDHLFPEIYRVMQPAVKNALDMWLSQSPSPESLSSAHLDHLAVQALSMAGIDNEPEDAVSAMAPPRHYYRRHHRPHFDTSDLAKILLLQEFFRRYGYYPPYGQYPYYRY